MKMSLDIEIPSSVDVNRSYVIILNHQHALDAYIINQVKIFLSTPKYVVHDKYVVHFGFKSSFLGSTFPGS